MMILSKGENNNMTPNDNFSRVMNYNIEIKF